MTLREHRPAILEEIKRKVRTRDGFGCVFCGNMIIQYEHIVPYAKCKEHTVENLTLLCANCHMEVTAGRRSKGQVKKAQSEPFCKKSGNSPQFDFLAARTSSISFGGTEVIVPTNSAKRFGLVRLSDTSFIDVAFEDGIPYFYAKIPSIKGTTGLRIDKNEISIADPNTWDAKLTGTQFLIRAAKGKILLKAKIENGNFQFERLLLSGPYNAVRVCGGKTLVLSDNRGGTMTIASCRAGYPGEGNSVLASASLPGYSCISILRSEDIDPAIAWRWMFKTRR